MTDENHCQQQQLSLRERAEARLRPPTEKIGEMAPAQVQKLVHELQTHQIELELQNEELRRAQEELVETRDRFQNLYDLAPVGYVTTSQTGQVLEANLTLCSMLGVERGQLLRQTFSAYIIKEDQDIYYHLRRNLIEPGRREECELRIQPSDGEPIWVRMECITESTAHGEHLLRSTISDVTARRRAEEERNDLELQVQQAKRMESLGVLAGGFAQDFNNKLGAIFGYGDLALGEVSPGSAADTYLNQMLVAATHAAKTVKQILEFSRQGGGERRFVHLDPLVEGWAEQLRQTLPANITVSYEANADVPPVKCDVTQIRQVIANLSINAHQAMWWNGGTLSLLLTKQRVHKTEVGLQPPVQEGVYAHLAVQDTGSGIQPEILDRIFEPFFTTRKTGEGSGMGLAVSHGIVVSHGGFLTVETEVGVGSVFHIYLPAAQSEHLPAAQKEHLPAAQKEHVPAAQSEP